MLNLPMKILWDKNNVMMTKEKENQGGFEYHSKQPTNLLTSLIIFITTKQR